MDFIAYLPPDHELLSTLLKSFTNKKESDCLRDVGLIDSLSRLLQSWEARFGRQIVSGEFHDVYNKALTTVIKFANQFALACLEDSDDDFRIQDAILEFYEQAINLPQVFSCLRTTTIFTPQVAYRILFSGLPMSVSRMCGLVVRYKSKFNYPSSSSRTENEDEVNRLNTMVVDICNMLWKDKAFIVKNGAGNGFDLDNSFVQYLGTLTNEKNFWLPSFFNLVSGSTFSIYSQSTIEELEKGVLLLPSRHEGLITASSLEVLSMKGGISISYDQFRVKLLERIKSEGQVGVYDLLYSSMRSLIDLKSTA